MSHLAVTALSLSSPLQPNLKGKAPDEKKQQSCQHCFAEGQACIRLADAIVVCVDDGLVAAKDCKELCPRALGMTKSCTVRTYSDN